MTEPTKPLQFIANIANRQAAIMTDGEGNRCLITLETFQIWAAVAHVGMMQFSGRQFLVTIQELPDKQEGSGSNGKVSERPERKSKRATA